MNPLLVLEDVTRHFGGVPAVDSLNLSVRPGTITGLIGPNGAGKTTVVNLIMGIFHLTKGRILLDGEDMSRAEAPVLARAGVGRTFQNIRLMPHATVIENVLAGFHRHERAGIFANLIGLGAARQEKADFTQRAIKLLERFDMGKFIHHRAGQLSYGHQRRIEMMRALAMNPRVLLLDEPVAGMNDAEASDLGKIFRDVADDGVAVLLIEHNMRFVTSICSYTYVLSAGRLISEGLPNTVLKDPKVVQAYLGS